MQNLNSKEKEWLSKYNLDYKLYFANPKNKLNSFKIIEYKKKNYKNIILENKILILMNAYLKIENNKEINIPSIIFENNIGFSKFDFLLKYYFNQFEINQFSNILFLKSFSFNIYDKIKYFFNIIDIEFKNIDKLSNNLFKKKKWDLIFIFSHNFTEDNKIKNIESIIQQFFKMLLYLINNKMIHTNTVICFSLIPNISKLYFDLLIFLENFFNITFFSVYKIQNINKQTIEIVLSNHRNINILKKYLTQILKYTKIENGFLSLKEKPNRSSIYLFFKMNKFLIERFIFFYKLDIKNLKRIQNIYKKTILKTLFTCNIPNTNALQIPYFINLLKNKENEFKIGNILYNFVFKNNLSKIICFGLSNAYYNVFILLALQKNKTIKNKKLISLDKNQKKIFQNKGILLIEKLNLFKNHYYIEESIDSFFPKLISVKEKIDLFVLGMIYYNFNILHLEFNLSLKASNKNSYFLFIQINEPGINKFINYITNNCFFFEKYYSNFFLIIYKIIDYKKLKNYINCNDFDTILIDF